jgi:hypothetical protein
MRGAGMRLNLDIRRHWKCPVCAAERRLPATVTTVRCGCAGGPMMQLVEAMRRSREISAPPTGVLEFDLSLDPVTIPENLPVPDPSTRRGPRPRRGAAPEAPPAKESNERGGPPRHNGPRGKAPPQETPAPPATPAASVESAAEPTDAPEDDFGAGLDASIPDEAGNEGTTPEAT